jgi:hypothetical protein
VAGNKNIYRRVKETTDGSIENCFYRTLQIRKIAKAINVHYSSHNFTRKKSLYYPLICNKLPNGTCCKSNCSMDRVRWKPSVRAISVSWLIKIRNTKLIIVKSFDWNYIAVHRKLFHFHGNEIIRMLQWATLRATNVMNNFINPENARHQINNMNNQS